MLLKPTITTEAAKAVTYLARFLPDTKGGKLFGTLLVESRKWRRGLCDVLIALWGARNRKREGVHNESEFKRAWGVVKGGRKRSGERKIERAERIPLQLYLRRLTYLQPPRTYRVSRSLGAAHLKYHVMLVQ